MNLLCTRNGIGCDPIFFFKNQTVSERDRTVSEDPFSMNSETLKIMMISLGIYLVKCFFKKMLFNKFEVLFDHFDFTLKNVDSLKIKFGAFERYVYRCFFAVYGVHN